MIKKIEQSIHDFIVYYQGFAFLAIILVLISSIISIVKLLA